MSDARLQPMRLAISRQVDAQAVRRFGLADAGNVVVFAFYGQQCNAPNGPEIDRTLAMRHLALR